jgi:hypothetical protein
MKSSYHCIVEEGRKRKRVKNFDAGFKGIHFVNN